MINQTILNKMQAIQAEQLAKATKVQPTFTAPKKEITDTKEDETPELSTLTFDEIISNTNAPILPTNQDEQTQPTPEPTDTKDEIIKTLKEMIQQQEAIIANLKTQLLEATATEIKPCKPTVSINHEKKGIELKFECKPSQSTLDSLKVNGWRWSKYNSIWYNTHTAENLNFANSI